MTVASRPVRPDLRPQVAASWRRALAAGVAPDDSSDPVIEPDSRLGEARERHPLSEMVADIHGAMAWEGHSDDHLLVITDASGVILWMAGSPFLRRRIDRIGMLEGAHWSEFDVGTNAIGTALHDQRATFVSGPEHLVISHRDWLCAADVIRDPRTGEVVAAIDLTAPVKAGRSIAVAAVRAGARLAESLLARLPDRAALPAGPADPVDLQLLGPGQPMAFGLPLTARRADILALLVDHPDGLTADEIAYRLFGDDGKATTVRAEIHRIRQQFPGLVVGRPYRLAAGVRTDVGLVRELASRGSALAAVDAYSDDLLPRSTALEIEMIRSELRQTVRAAAIGSGGAALASWCDSRAGRHDLAAIERRLAELSAGDRGREHLLARRRRLLADPA